MRLIILALLVVVNAGCIVVRPRPAVYGSRDPMYGTPPPPVAGHQWRMLGERTVGHSDRDTIHVGAVDGTFVALQIRVERSAIVLYDMVVEFGDGERWSPPMRYTFGPNTNSHVIDLPGGARVIRKVTFFYSDLPGHGRARVELWGR